MYYFKAFFKVVMLFKKHGIIDDDLWRCNAEVNNPIIYSFCGLKKKKKINTAGSNDISAERNYIK